MFPITRTFQTLRLALTLSLSLALAACGGGGDGAPNNPAPGLTPNPSPEGEFELSIESISPAEGSVRGGTRITIRGAGFDTDLVVTFDGVPAEFVDVVSETMATAVTPEGTPGTVQVAVSIENETASSTFVYLEEDVLTLTDVTPNTGSTDGGETVTLRGENFSSGMKAFFGAEEAELVISSATSATAVTPAGPEGKVDVTITLGDQTSTLVDAFTYTAPEVLFAVNLQPRDLGFNVGVDENIEVEFNLEIDESTVTFLGFQLVDSDGRGVSGTLSVDGRVIRLDPSEALRSGELYTAEINPAIRSTSGAALSGPRFWTFRTSPQITISSITPNNDAHNVRIDQPVEILFSQPLDPNSVDELSIRVQARGIVNHVQNPFVDGTVELSSNGSVLTFTPDSPWQEYNTIYWVFVPDTLRGQFGQAVQSGNPGAFTTIQLDPAYLYHIHTQRFLRDRPVTTFSNTGNTFLREVRRLGFDRGNYWYVTHHGTYFALSNGISGFKVLESGNGDLSRFTDRPAGGGFYAGQLWKATTAARLATVGQREGESPYVYYLQSLSQGDDSALTFALEGGYYQGRMRPKTSDPLQYFWFERNGRR